MNWYKTAQSNIHGYPLEFDETTTTNDRVDELMSNRKKEWWVENEQRLGTEREYQKEVNGKEGEIKWMSPDEYLNTCAVAFQRYQGGDATLEESRQILVDTRRESINDEGEGHPNLIESYKDRWINGEQPPMGYLIHDKKGRWIGQQGMHRALMAKDLGIDEIPVMMITQY